MSEVLAAPLDSIREVQRNFSDAAAYARLYEDSSRYARLFAERMRIVIEAVGNLPSGKVLDVGCGPGILLSRMASADLGLFGVDCCPEMIAEAKNARQGRM
jgi:2-polyprenyl-3-methyl-5-hydroxy-6-metoxy-1,4-benzoquinol methylase